MTEAEKERAAVVAWLEVQANRKDLEGRGICANIRAAWVMLTNPSAVYRGAAFYFADRIHRSDHTKENDNAQGFE